MRGHEYEAVIYDRRDMTANEPASTLGTWPTAQRAWEAIIDFIRTCDADQIYKAEVLGPPQAHEG